MHHSFTLAASLLTLLPTVFAAGTAHVVNNCGTDVWFASVAQNVGAAMQKLPSGGYSESFSKPNVGISIKLAATEGGAVTQFEFTWDSPNVAYDISNIDGNPFAQQGMSLVPSMIGAAGFPTCVAVNCPAGQDRCDAAYNLPDDVRTKVCPENSDLTFTLCPGGAVAPPSAPSSSARASASAPASTPVSAPPSMPSSTKAVQTSFRTSTTPAANAPPAAASSQYQAPAAPSDAAPTNAANTPDTGAPTPVTTPAAQNTATAQTGSWSWGGRGGGRYHTKRAHMHRFDS